MSNTTMGDTVCLYRERKIDLKKSWAPSRNKNDTFEARQRERVRRKKSEKWVSVKEKESRQTNKQKKKLAWREI